MTDQFDTAYFESAVLFRTPCGRPGQADELGAALIFLAGDASSYATGITLPVERGMLTS